MLQHVALLPPENTLVGVSSTSQHHRYLTTLVLAHEARRSCPRAQPAGLSWPSSCVQLGLAPWLMANYEKEMGNKLALDLAQLLQKVQLQKFTDLLCSFAKVRTIVPLGGNSFLSLRSASPLVLLLYSRRSRRRRNSERSLVR